MKLARIILLLVFITGPILQSCQKDEPLTNGEKKGIELKKFITDNKLRYIEAINYYNSTYSNSALSANYKIEGSFIMVGEYWFSLDKLSMYYITSVTIGTTPTNCLYLVFN